MTVKPSRCLRRLVVGNCRASLTTGFGATALIGRDRSPIERSQQCNDGMPQISKSTTPRGVESQAPSKQLLPTRVCGLGYGARLPKRRFSWLAHDLERKHR